LKCPKCGHNAIFGAFGVQELAYYYCAYCGATFPLHTKFET